MSANGNTPLANALQTYDLFDKRHANFAMGIHSRVMPAAGASVCLRRSATKAGGARRDRTDDLLLAKQALSQLSYGPLVGLCPIARRSRTNKGKG